MELYMFLQYVILQQPVSTLRSLRVFDCRVKSHVKNLFFFSSVLLLSTPAPPARPTVNHMVAICRPTFRWYKEIAEGRNFPPSGLEDSNMPKNISLLAIADASFLWVATRS